MRPLVIRATGTISQWRQFIKCLKEKNGQGASLRGKDGENKNPSKFKLVVGSKPDAKKTGTPVKRTRLPLIRTSTPIKRTLTRSPVTMKSPIRRIRTPVKRVFSPRTLVAKGRVLKVCIVV